MATNNLKDATLKTTTALPASATSVTGTGIDTGKATSQGVQPGGVDFLLTAPALAVGQLANASTMKYDVVMSDNADMSSPTTLYNTVITQTGAGGVGAATATSRFRIPSDAKRYIDVKATNSAAADASAAKMTLEMVF